MTGPRRYREGELLERDGGILPSLWDAIPGAQRNDATPLPETEDFGAYGGAGPELAAAEDDRVARRRRERAETKRRAAERALDELAAAPLVDPLAGLQMDPNAPESDAGRWFTENVGDPVRAGAANMLDALVLPRAALGALNEATGVDDYGTTVARAREGAARARNEHPWASAAGTTAAFPAALVSPQLLPGSVTATLPSASRVGVAGLEAMGYSALPGLIEGDAEEATEGALLGGGAAGTLGALGLGIEAAAPRLRQTAEALDEWSAPIRARAAGIRGIGAQRRVDQLPGSTRDFVNDLDRLGISPRGSISRVEDVGERAGQARQRAIDGIQGARDRMAGIEAPRIEAARAEQARRDAVRTRLDEAVLTDDPMMAPTPETSRPLVADRVRRSMDARRGAYEELVDELEGIRGSIRDAEVERAGAMTGPIERVDPMAQTGRAAAVGDRTAPSRPAARRLDTGAPTGPGGASARILELRQRLGGQAGARPNLSRDDVARLFDRDDVTGVLGQGVSPRIPGLRSTGVPPRDASSPSAADLARLLPEEPPIDPGGLVSGPDVAGRIRGIIERYRQIPGAEDLYRTGERLASQMEARGQIPWGEAEEIRRFWDDITNWQAQGPTSGALAPLQGVRRQLRGALQGVLDETVERHAPEMAGSYPQARRDYQVSDFTERMAHDDELRDASNRLLSPTDYGAGIGGASAGGAAGGGSGAIAGAALAVLGNRAIRGREHAISAAVAERGADALRRIPRLTPGNAMAPAVGMAAGVSQRDPARPRPVATPDVEGMSDAALLRVPEEQEPAAFDLDAMSDEELLAIPEEEP